jgi:hypothetical protein
MVDVKAAAFGFSSLVGLISRRHEFLSEYTAPQFVRKRRAAVDRVGVMPIPSKTAPSEVPLKMLSYCSILRPVLYGCLRMRAKTPPVTSSHAPKRSSYLYLEKACSGVWSVISATESLLQGWLVRWRRLSFANAEFVGEMAVGVHNNMRVLDDITPP